MPEVSRLAIAARLDAIRHACDSVVEAAENAGLDERDVYHCQMAVDEALTNIIEHGYDHDSDDQTIDVICTTEPGRFLITLFDDSPAFNPLEHEAPNPDEPLDSREPGGWGIYFIRRLMDDVSYTRENDRNVLLLVKQRALTTDALQPGGGETPFPVRLLDSTTAIVTPDGRLDSNTSIQLDQTLNAQLKQGRTWLFVDMADVEYIASSGLKVLVAAWRRAREAGGDVILSGLQPRLLEIFEMVGFDMLFQVYPDLSAALATRQQQG